MSQHAHTKDYRIKTNTGVLQIEPVQTWAQHLSNFSPSLEAPLSSKLVLCALTQGPKLIERVAELEVVRPSYLVSLSIWLWCPLRPVSLASPVPV